MFRPGSRPRAAALALLLALLGGGLGLPLLDAVAFHGRPGARPSAERILGAEGPTPAHFQVCVIPDAVRAGTTGLPGAAPALRQACSSEPPARLRAETPVLAHRPLTPALPRAPPALRFAPTA